MFKKSYIKLSIKWKDMHNVLKVPILDTKINSRITKNYKNRFRILLDTKKR